MKNTVTNHQNNQFTLKEANKIIVEKQETKQKAKAIIENITGKPVYSKKLETEKSSCCIQNTKKARKSLNFYSHNVPYYHPCVLTIGKYINQFKVQRSEEALKLLNGMKVIAEDELQLANGIVVKLGYPKVKTDNKEIFGKMLNIGDGKYGETYVIYFTNQIAFMKYQKEMKMKGFRIAGSKDDKDGKIFEREMNEIFDQFPGKGLQSRNTIILDILGRTFSGYHNPYNFSHNEKRYIGDVEDFWSCSTFPSNYPIPFGKDEAWYCKLSKENGSYPKFDIATLDHGCGALFFKDKK